MIEMTEGGIGLSGQSANHLLAVAVSFCLILALHWIGNFRRVISLSKNCARLLPSWLVSYIDQPAEKRLVT